MERGDARAAGSGHRHVPSFGCDRFGRRGRHYKPSPRAYQLTDRHLKFPPVRIGFVSANAWDAIGAKASGFTSFGIYRNQAPPDRHGPKPDAVLKSLAELPALVGSA